MNPGVYYAAAVFFGGAVITLLIVRAIQKHPIKRDMHKRLTKRRLELEDLSRKYADVTLLVNGLDQEHICVAAFRESLGLIDLAQFRSEFEVLENDLDGLSVTNAGLRFDVFKQRLSSQLATLDKMEKQAREIAKQPKAQRELVAK